MAVTMNTTQKVRLVLYSLDAHGNPVAPLNEGTVDWNSVLPDYLNLLVDPDGYAAWAVAAGKAGTVAVHGVAHTTTWGDQPFSMSITITPGPPVGVGLVADTPVDA